MQITWTPSGLEEGKIVSYLRYLRIVHTLKISETVNLMSSLLFSRFYNALKAVCGTDYAQSVKNKTEKMVAYNVKGLYWVSKLAKMYGKDFEPVAIADTPTTIEGLNGFRLRGLFHDAKGFIAENYDIDETAHMLQSVEKLGAEIQAEKKGLEFDRLVPDHVK